MIEFDAKGCGCCKDGKHATPRDIFNRPALSQVRYRVGDYGSFRRAMLEAIPTKQALRPWTARDETDYGIAVIDMWAYLGDILTFYQERIANEAFLRTAVHRESVMRLAALLDYRPSPGAAATTYVAFFLEKGKTLQIPIGLRLQSVPGQNEKPQKFETVEAIAADAGLNAIRIHGVPAPFNPFAKGSKGGPLTAPIIGVTAGTQLIVFDHRDVELKTVAAVTSDGETTTLEWSQAIHGNRYLPAIARAAAWSRRFALFGSDTPAKTMVATISEANTDKVGITYNERSTQFALSDRTRIPLDRALPDMKAGTRVLLVRAHQNADNPAAARMATVTGAEAKPFAMATTDNVTLTSYGATVTELAIDVRITSKPAAVLTPDDTLAVFATADDGAVWMRRNGPTWTDWQSLGGNFVEVAAAVGPPGGVQVFGREASGAMHLLSASGWGAFGGTVDLFSVHTAQARLYAVARGSDGRATLKRQDANGAWGDWQTLQGPQCDLVTAVTMNNNAIEVFVRRAGNNDVWTRREIAPGGAWTAWQLLGGIVRALEAAVNQNGNVEVFGIGGNHALYSNRRNGGVWSGWVSRLGWIDRMSVRRVQGRLTAFARGGDQRVWLNRQTVANATTWTGWSLTAGSPQIESLDTVLNSWEGIHVFADGGSALFERNTGASWINRGVPMWPIPDRRRLSVYELTSDPLPLATLRYPDTIVGGPVVIPLSKLASLDKNRTIILDDAAKQPHTATVASAIETGEHLLVSFTPGLTRALDGASATLFGNVAKVTHGETKSDVLGSGDAAARFQTFRVPKSPVTFVPQAGARNGVASTLEVRVDGVKWSEVDTLLERTKDDRVFVTRVEEDASMTVQFGGEPGAHLTTGRSNVTAKYRVGLGSEGNVRPGALSNLLDRPPGLKSAVNPGAAEGGAAGESGDGIRTNAPNTVRTFNRIVSLRDFEDAAREHASVAKARATWLMEDYERVVSLTLAAEGGAVMSNDAIRSIAADLDAKRDLNRPMRARSHANVPFVLTAVLQVDAAYLLENVQKSAQDAVAAYFSFNSRELAQAVHLSDVYAVLQGVTGVVAAGVKGVVAARITRLRKKSGGPEVGDHILLLPHEIAALSSADDAVIAPQFESL